MAKTTTPKVSDLLASTSKRKSKKQEMKKDDEFVTTFRGVLGSLEKNSKQLLIGIIALVAMGAVALVAMSTRKAKENQASNELYGAISLYDEEMKAKQDEVTKAENEKNKDKKDTAKAPPKTTVPEDIAIDPKMDLAKSLPALEKVAKNFSETRAGHEAQMKLAGIYISQNQWKEATPWIEMATESASQSLDKASAFNLMAMAAENNKDFDKAITYYDKALRVEAPALKGELLSGLARSQKLAGKTDEAKKTYNRIIEELPKSSYSQRAETLKARL